MQRWAANTLALKRGELFRLHGIDQSNTVVGLDDLFFVVQDDHFIPKGAAGMPLLNQELINTATLRNAFFPQILMAHGEDLDVSLNVVFQGRFQVTVYQCRMDQEPVALVEKIITSDEIVEAHVAIGALSTLPRGVRLFWVARALSDTCVLIDATWQARAPAATQARMVVAIRTFGRSADVQRLLARFHDQAIASDYGQMLKNTFFLVYDALGTGAAPYAPHGQADPLNLFVMSGPNMGGAGNLSLELLALQTAVTAAGITVDELVIADDDLSISLESLARNWAATLFRKDQAFHTLPIFLKSEPRMMWEDGGFWGRYTRDNPGGQRSAVAPRLLRHAKVFHAANHLGEMARLHHPEYSAFIFLSMPYTRLADLGLPCAMFLRGDDIEYCLRNVASGGVTVSNPNLAAWHEPAHSYAQEYMSIAHGVIINMAYGQRKPDDLATFFHRRAAVHLSLSDVAGLTVYAEALADLVACDRLLQPDFAGHYLSVMARFKSFDAAFSVLADELVASLTESSAREGKVTAVAPFLYMEPYSSTDPLDHVVLVNTHTDKRCIYDPFETDRLAALSSVAARLYASLAVFIQNFDTLRAHYRERIATSASAAFWLAEAEGKAFGVLHGG
ncbi:MAG: hypothetical protein WCO04_08505 [Pseudomonadota bacterium]